MKKIQLLCLRCLQIYLFLLFFNTSFAQTAAWMYADSMMNTPEGEALYEDFMESETEFTDSTEIEGSAYMASMYFYMGEWYAAHGHLCTAISLHGNESSSRTLDPDSLCYNEQWLLSNQNDDFLEGWEICEGSRQGVLTEDCDHDDIMFHSLPDEARPTFAEDPDPGFRFNLNPLNNADRTDLPGSVRRFANYDACELNLLTDGTFDIGTNGLLPMNPPTGGRSIRINNEHNQYHVNTIRKYFIPSENDSVYYFSYAYVMEDPDHSPRNQPFFRVTLRDETCAVVEERCFIAQQNAPGTEFVNNENFDAPVVYKQWTCDSFDLRPYVEDNGLMSIEFVAADCGLGQHFGYAYIAEVCQACGNGPEIVLDSTQYLCPEFPIEFCGNVSVPEGWELLDLGLLIYQTLDSLGQADSLMYVDSTGDFCFYLLEEDVQSLANGGYDVYAVAYLINPDGDTVKITSLSAFPNNVESTDNDFFLGLFEECLELTAYLDCKDSTFIQINGTYDPIGEGLDSFDLANTIIIVQGDTINLTLLGHDDVNGFFNLLGNYLEGFGCPEEIEVIIPSIGIEDSLHFEITVCRDSCIQVGYWIPEIPICAPGDTISICGEYLAPRDQEGSFTLQEVIVCLISVNEVATINTDFSVVGDDLCVNIPIGELIDSCYELTFTLIYLDNDDNQYVQVISNIDSLKEDICFPFDDCCPDSLIVVASTHVLIPVFGDSDCDEYVYYVEGKYTIPEGYVFCDSLPVFEGGYFVYDDVSYNQFPWNHVNFSGHLYVTDMAAYMSTPGLIGQFMICDDSTGAICPAKVTIQYRAPMNGMMCNFTHCLNCISCNNSYGQNVPVKSCMTLQFPTCWDDCDINEYYLSIIKPDLLNPLVLYTDTIVWDSNGINQDYCFEYILKYYHSTYPCYQVKLETNCGQTCLSSICLNNLVPCYTIIPLQQVDNPVSLLQNELEVYPNPNNGDLVNLKAGNVTSGIADVTVYTFQGSISRLERIDFHGQNGSISTKDLHPGTYLISVQDKVTGARCVSKYIHMD